MRDLSAFGTLCNRQLHNVDPNRLHLPKNIQQPTLTIIDCQIFNYLKERKVPSDAARAASDWNTTPPDNHRDGTLPLRAKGFNGL